MARVTQKEIPSLPEGVHRIESGLYLRVRGKYRSFFAKFQINGKRREYAIGPAGEFSLAAAKRVLAKVKGQLAEGIDPWEKRKAEKAPRPKTFADYAELAITAIESARRWKNAKHAAQWRSTVRTYANPVFGKKPVGEVTRDDVLAVLSEIWETKTDTASRLRGRLETIFDQAIFEGVHPGPNPAHWRGNLNRTLPPVRRIHTVKHQEAMTLEEAREVVRYVSGSRFVSHQALLFGMLTASRVNEFTGAKWEEVDLVKAVWSCPRRKDGKPFPHRVPLSSQALELLNGLERKNEYIFPGPSGAPLCIDTCRVTLRRIIKRPVTMHGCRSTFRDWCEETGVPWVLAEKSLMHTTGSEVERAYQRSDLLEQRRPVMQAWTDALFKPE